MVVVLVAAVVGKLLVRRWMWLNMGVCGMRPCGCGCECGMLCVVVVGGVGVGVFVGVSVGVDVHFSNKYPAIRSLADSGRFANTYSFI